MSKRISLIFWFSFSGCFLFAQQLHWTNFRLTNDLSDAHPRALYESQDGLIWLATSKGISAFDGNSFIDRSRQDSLPADARAVYEDRKGTLWVGYADGSIDHLLDGKLRPWEPEEGHPATPITGFAEDKDGRIWFATYGEGAYVMGDRYLYNFDLDDGLPGNDIYTIASLPNGDIWLGSDGGISICKFNGDQKEVSNLTRKEGLPDEIVRVILPDAMGNAWIGTHDKGVAFYDNASGTFHSLTEHWPHGPITDLELIEGRELIIATESNGVWRLTLENNFLERLPTATGNLDETTKVQDLLLDAEGGLWLLSKQPALLRANLKLAFITTAGREVQSVLLSKKGKLWAGTNRGLFHFRNDGEFIPYPITGELNIVSMFEDRFGNIWLGTFDDGVYIVNPNSGIRTHLGEAEGLRDGSILSIDGKGHHVWLVSLGGVTKVTLEADPIATPPLAFKKVKGIKTDFIYQVFTESADRAWFATDGEGLALYDHGTVTHLRKTKTLTSDSVDLRRIYSLTSTANKSIWFNTAREGLFELAGDSLYARGLTKTVPGNKITALAPAGASQLVVSHAEGVALLDLSSSNYQNIFDQQTNGPNFRPILNAVSTGNGGQAWFGCSGGLIRYWDLPDSTINRPRIVLRSVSIYPSDKPEPERKKFGYNENTLAFDFHGLWFTSPEKIRCRYQLEGYDPGWIETRNQRVIYSKLTPGNYTFKVAATANKDWVNASIKTYTFSIASPFWKRWWFIISCLALGLLLGRYLIQYRDQQLRRTALMQKQRIESQYEVLKSQINPHFLFNSFNTLIAMIEEAPGDAVQYTERLSDLFRNVLQYRDREVIPITEELTLLSDYLFLLEKRFNDKLKITIDLPPNAGFIVPLSLQLLVENAIKHNVVSATRPLRVRIGLNKGKGYICVQNPLQPKLRKEPSTGFGHRSLSERYALLTPQKMIIEETAESFRVCIPILPSPPANDNS